MTDLGGQQREHWEGVHRARPAMYGWEPSSAAVHAARVFAAAGAQVVLELGAGHGRDAAHFARRGFRVLAGDFSAEGLVQLRARVPGVGAFVHDARDPLPLATAGVDAAFAHMLLCMALSTDEIRRLVGEVARVLRPGGTFVYTARHTGDAHHGTGIAHGDDIYEQDGFAVHFFPRALVDGLAEGWVLAEVHPFEEGELPRRLWRVTQVLR
ncbi:class I SAM-dependent methyltransferase [Saccharopolyspora griseoalba]|uniref:Class I SAM-dependent methyltransferase n=1 Tax=Saccharopolyspora griseoalba TaxID=1431848 RepID=A0ABW2LS20_9PSEU